MSATALIRSVRRHWHELLKKCCQKRTNDRQDYLAYELVLLNPELGTDFRRLKCCQTDLKGRQGRAGANISILTGMQRVQHEKLIRKTQLSPTNSFAYSHGRYHRYDENLGRCSCAQSDSTTVLIKYGSVASGSPYRTLLPNRFYVIIRPSLMPCKMQQQNPRYS